MAKLPKAVQRQVRRANRLAKEAGLENAPEEKNEEEVVADGLQPEPIEEPQPEDSQPKEPQPEPQPEEPPLEAAEPQPEEPQPVDWEQRYKVLQGKYDAEVPRLSEQVRQQDAEMANMRAVLAAVGQNNPDPEPEKRTVPEQRFLTDDEIKEYGPDFVDVVKRAAQELLGPEIKRLQEENKFLLEQMGGFTHDMALTQQERVYAALDDEVENWREVNKSEGFGAWLGELDPYSGAQRNQLLRAAFDRGDAIRVVAFFKGYLTEHATVTPKTNGAASAETTQPAERPSLESMAAPGQSKAASGNGAPKEQPKKQWTQKEIAAFYDAANKGQFKGREADKTRIERDIVAAAREGRISA